MTEPSVVVVTTGSHRRWQWWRDLVIVALAVAVAALVILNVQAQHETGKLREALDATTAERGRQVAELTASLNDLQTSLDRANGEIARLTGLVIALGGDPSLPPSASGGQPSAAPVRPTGVASPGTQPTARASPSPAPAAAVTLRPTPSARPSNRSAQPSPSPRRSPSPSPTCLLPLPAPLPCR